MKKEIQNHRKIFSFDVFDTCISRTYEKPSDLFFHVGLLISPSPSGSQKSEEFAQNFMRARILAERKANKYHGRKRSCTFGEIYSLIEIPYECEHSKFEIMRIELKLEYEASYCIYTTRSIIDDLRNDEKKIIFISDMYHDKKFIQKLLMKHGLFRENDAIYVSSETSFTKKSGRLFRYILERESVLASEILHHGDNRYSDVVVPQRLGIDAVHIDYTTVNKLEKYFPETRFDPLIRRINSISKFVRLSKNLNSTSAEINFFSHAAPLLIAFTLWTLSEAKKSGVKRLYFVARDGELPFKLANILNRTDIELRYLHGSRRAWLAPSIDWRDASWLKLAIPKDHESSVIDALERMGLETPEIVTLQRALNIPARAWEDPREKEECEALIRSLLSEDLVKHSLDKRISESREICMTYFEQEGLFDSIPWGIADVGWSLNAHLSLQKIISTKGESNSFFGFYFGISPTPNLDKRIKNAFSFINDREFFFAKAMTIEHAFLATNSRSTIGYESINEKILPKLAPQKHNGENLHFPDNLHDYMCLYAQAMIDHNIPEFFFVHHKDHIEKKTKRFFENPPKDIAEYLSNFFVYKDMRHTNDRKIPHFSKITFTEAIKIFICFFRNQKNAMYFWPEASIQISNVKVKVFLKILMRFKKVQRYFGKSK